MAVVLAGSAAWLFVGLGDQAFWDDEANTVLFAGSVWRTGDTNAHIGHNIVAYGAGRELKNGKGRYMPPLSYYVAAPFVGLSHAEPFVSRLPFALFGLATVGLMAWWIHRDGADARTWWVLTLAILGNIPLMLYARQCRYWSAAMFFSVLVAYFYVHWDGRRRTVIFMAISSLLLLASNYMSYLALQVLMLVDYIVWQRKARPIKWPDWLTYLLPQVVLGGLLVLLIRPEKDTGIELLSAEWFERGVRQFLLSMRDICRCEFGVLALIVAGPIIGHFTGNKWLLRGFVGVVMYSVVVGFLAPEALKAPTAPMRLYAPAIPLYLALSALALLELTKLLGKLKWLAVPLAAVVFLTNVLCGGWLWDQPLRCTPYEFACELATPPPNAYSKAADWVKENVEEGQSIWVQPYYTPYPMMVLAPKAVYAWQFPPKAKRHPQFSDLPDAHFMGRSLPDYMIAFGPQTPISSVLRQLRRQGVAYERAATLDIYWNMGLQTTRPEFYAHRFRNVMNYDPNTEAVYVYRRVRPAMR